MGNPFTRPISLSSTHCWMLGRMATWKNESWKTDYLLVQQPTVILLKWNFGRKSTSKIFAKRLERIIPMKWKAFWRIIRQFDFLLVRKRKYYFCKISLTFIWRGNDSSGNRAFSINDEIESEFSVWSRFVLLTINRSLGICIEFILERDEWECVPATQFARTHSRTISKCVHKT